MAKLTMEQHDEILRHMFSLVNETYTREYVKEDRWYTKHRFKSKEQENEFEEWLIRFLMRVQKVKREFAKEQAMWWMLAYSWASAKPKE